MCVCNVQLLYLQLIPDKQVSNPQVILNLASFRSLQVLIVSRGGYKCSLVCVSSVCGDGVCVGRVCVGCVCMSVWMCGNVLNM